MYTIYINKQISQKCADIFLDTVIKRRYFKCKKSAERNQQIKNIESTVRLKTIYKYGCRCSLSTILFILRYNICNITFIYNRNITFDRIHRSHPLV